MFTFSNSLHSQLDEKTLIHQLNKGEEDAFTEIYNRYWEKLLAVAASSLNNLAEAEELVQDIFLDLWNRKENLTITSSLSAYLAVAVKYKVLDQLAKRAQRMRYQQHAIHCLSPADTSTEQWLQSQEIKARIQKSVEELPEKCRLVFELSRNVGLTQKQIASRMGIAEKTVEAHLSKALRALRLSLASLLYLLFLFLRA